MSTNTSQHTKTGRTTRMLEHAKRLVRGGAQDVYVIADNALDLRRLEITCGEPKLGIKFTLAPEDFDWEQMRFSGAKHDCIVLVDHHVIEDRFARVIEMLHFYDKPQNLKPVAYFKFWATGKTADGNTSKTEGHISIEMEGDDSMPPQEAFDKCAEFLAKEFPTVRFIEGETKLKRLKKKPQ